MKRFILSLVLSMSVLCNVWAAQYLTDPILTGTSGIYTDSRAYTSLSAAVAGIGANERDLYIAQQESVATLTIPSNIRLHFLKSGSLSISTQLTLQTTQIFAGDQQIFSGAGDIDFASGSIVRSTWFSDIDEALDVTSDDTLVMTIAKTETTTASAAVGNNVTLRWNSPFILTVDSGHVLSNVKNIEAGNYQIFGGAGDIDFLDGTRLNLDWFPHLRSAITWVESEEVTIEVSGTHTVDYTDTVDSNEVLDLDGGILSISGGVTLTIDSHVSTGPKQIFSGTGSVTMSNAPVSHFEWFGAVGDGSTDDTDEIQALYDSLSLPSRIQLLPKTYKITSQILVNGTNLDFITIGSGGTTFNEVGVPYKGSTFYCVGSSTTFFLFDGNGAVEHSGPIFENVNFVGSSKTSTILLQLESVNRWTLRNVSFRGADVGLSTLDTDGDASWGYISQPIVKDCNTGFDLNSSVTMVGGDIEPASGGKGIQIANDWSSSKIVGVKFDGASAATGVHIIGYRNIVSSSVFEGCDPAIYLDHDGGGHALSGDDNRIIGNTIFGSDSTETGITVEANANRNQLIGNGLFNLATDVDDSGSYTVRLDDTRFDYGVQNGILSHDSTGYWENVLAIKGTGGNPYLEITDTGASGHQYRIRTWEDELQFRDETSGNALVRLREGRHVYLGETTDPGVVTANVGLLYVKDNGAGKSQLCVVFGTGAVQVLATEP